MSKKAEVAARQRVAAKKSKSSVEVREGKKPIGKTVTKKEVAQLKKKLEPTQLLKGKDPSKVTIPKRDLGACVDLYEEARRRRLEIQGEAQSFAELESRLREFLIDNVGKSNTAGVTGRTHRVSVKVKSVPRIEDEAKFMAAAKRKGNEDLLKQTINDAAIRERWDAGKTIPGVGTFEVVSLSLNKL